MNGSVVGGARAAGVVGKPRAPEDVALASMGREGGKEGLRVPPTLVAGTTGEFAPLGPEQALSHLTSLATPTPALAGRQQQRHLLASARALAQSQALEGRGCLTFGESDDRADEDNNHSVRSFHTPGGGPFYSYSSQIT